MRLIAAKGRFIHGEYRRHMKTIGYLGELDKLVGLKGGDTKLEHDNNNRADSGNTTAPKNPFINLYPARQAASIVALAAFNVA